MGEVRHRTVIDVDLATDAAEQKLARLEAIAQRLGALLGGAGGGAGGGGAAPTAVPGGGGGGQGGGTPGAAPSANPGGGGAPAIPPVPGGGGGAPPTPGPAPAPAAPNPAPGVPPGGAPIPPSDARGRFTRLGGGGDDGFFALNAGRGYQVAGLGAIGIAAREAVSMQGFASAERQAEFAAAADVSIAAPFSLAAQRQSLQGMREGMQVRTAGGAASALAGLGVGAAFGGPAGVAVAAIGSALTELFATKKEQQGAEVAAALGAAGQAISFRAQIAGRRASFDFQNGMLGLYGTGIGPGAGAGLGMLPEESMAAMMGFGQAAGFRGAFDGQRALAMSRSSVSPGTAGALRGLAAAGAGGTGDVNPERFIGLAQLSGLMGSKADDYLARITAATTSMAEQGLKLDIGATQRFLGRIAAAEGEGRYSGLEQSRAVSSLAGTVGGARQRLLSPYANVVENAVFMQALRGGGGTTMGTLQELERIGSRPEDIRRAALSNYGQSTATLGFAALGNSSAMSELLGGLTGGDVASPRMKVAGGGKLAVARARAQAKLLSEIGDGDTEIFDAEARIQIRVLALGSKMVDVIGKLETTLEKLNTKVEEVIKETDFAP